MVRRALTHVGGGAIQAKERAGGNKCMDEGDVLEPVTVGMHPDDWPCFVLNEAVVLDKDGKIANLLEAEIDGPMTVRGRLEVDKEFRHLRKVRDLKNVEVEVNDVRGFSMGLGPVTIWALGKAGWFEIKPAHKYQTVFEKMTEGVCLYYFLADRYEMNKSWKTQGGKALEMNDILNEYSKQRAGPVTQVKFAKICSDHALFLLSQMQKPHEPVRWSKTTFFAWLISSYPDTYSRYKKGIEDDKDANDSIKHTRKYKEKGLVSQKVSRMTKNIRIILATLHDMYTMGCVRRSKLTLRQLSRALYENFEIPNIFLAQEYIRANAEALVKMLGSGWGGKEWQITPLYLKLEEAIHRPGSRDDLREVALKFVLQPRTYSQHLITKVIHRSSDDEKKANTQHASHTKRPESDDDTTTSSRSRGDPVRSLDRYKNGDKGKEQQIPRNGILLKELEEISSGEDISIPSTGRRSIDSHLHKISTSTVPPCRKGPSQSGKKAALRLVQSSIVPDLPNPLVSSDEDEDKAGVERSRKRLKIFHSPSRDDAESADSMDSDDQDTETETSEDVDEEAATTVNVEFALESISLPLTSPGKNGVWTCDREGCSHSIMNAHNEEGKSRVRDHYFAHASQIATREKLVLEEAKPGLKVNHLLEKIRKIGEKSRLAEQTQIGGRIVPQPIKRSVLR